VNRRDGSPKKMLKFGYKLSITTEFFSTDLSTRIALAERALKMSNARMLCMV
jgi:hypothetical protein